ncbi:MAG TPA: aspartate aminotransferase family protein [Acidisoma sp.]|uniref:aspartate aminotransferase family protein n=1 Tax=Acidisoma sp. TaxID=1872115 RepID=UPI002BCCD087|nr:aspartate aminotransferase family protein [Acidisoma sp.]HTI00746.1 aspartate aminotransferase family protein [Acidisoma sp.]
MDPSIAPILSLNAYQASDGQTASPAVARRLAAFGRGAVLFYREPIEMVSAQGTRLRAADGREYLDLYNNVPSVGHCHPHVVRAVQDQVAKLNIHTRYLVDVVTTYAERLLGTFPAPLSNVTFSCTGSEANDLALRIARLATGAQGIIVTAGAYHGNTMAVTEVSPSTYKTGRPPASVRTVPAPDPRHYGPDIAGGFARAVETEIAELAAMGIGTAALLVDTIFSSDGIFADPPGFLAPAVAAVHAAGGLFIADEVQPGFGRTGAGLWGFARHGVTPDIVTLGKPMGNGFPLAGLVTRPELLGLLTEHFGYFNTFGGNPVAAAAGLAVLEVIEQEGLIANARDVGAYLRDGVRALSAERPVIGEVRGAGLYTGVDIIDPESGGPDAARTTALMNALRDRGVLIGAAGLGANVLKIRPPLCLSRADVDVFIAALWNCTDRV